MNYDPVALICFNGHCITNKLNRSTYQKYCNLCGAETIYMCPSCQSPIKGNYYESLVDTVADNYRIPNFCPDCGNQYPWTKSALASVIRVIDLDKKLSGKEKDVIKQALPNIMIQTPTTKESCGKINKSLKKLGKFSAEALRQFVIDFACELAKNSLGF